LTRRWLVVFEDPESELTLPEELEAYLAELVREPFTKLRVARVQRGGLLADKVMAELPPVRHEHMGRPR
jgi:hypothetical protein